jgi:hypothetical protein
MLTSRLDSLRASMENARLRMARTRLALRDAKWLGPVLLALIITVCHFSIPPREMFWHDLLRRAYYVSIVWAIYLHGLRGRNVSIRMRQNSPSVKLLSPAFLVC